MKYLLTTVVFALCIVSAPSFARSSGGHRDTRSFDHFAHKSCSSSNCFSNHPSGTYTFPYHEGRR